MSTRPEVIIVTLLSQTTGTGVEVHCNQITEAAVKQGYNIHSVNPYIAPFIRRKISRAFIRLARFLGDEYADLVWRWSAYYLLKISIRKLLKEKSGNVVFYAQDPLSAKAAIDSRKSEKQYVSIVVHFNNSEAQEYIDKGITNKDSMLYRDLVKTEAYSFPRVDKIIYVSEYMKKIVEGRFPLLADKGNCIVIPNFVKDLSKITGSDEIKADLINIGTLEHRKNQEFLLDVLHACNKKGRFYTLSIIGDGPDMGRLVKKSVERGLGGQVSFYGYMKDAVVHIKKHRIYVHASRMESFGITLIEAYSAGCPVLAAPVGGIPEIVDHGVDGFLWDLNDVELSSNLLIKTMSDEGLLSEMSKAAKVKFVNKFSDERLSEVWLKELTYAS